MVIIESDNNFFKFVGEHADVESYCRGMASLTLARYKQPGTSDEELTELLFELEHNWGVTEQNSEVFKDVCDRVTELRNQRIATLLLRAHEGYIPLANVYAEKDDFRTVEDVSFVRSDGLSYGIPADGSGALDAKEVVVTDVRDALDLESIPEGLWVTSSAVQHELLFDEGTEQYSLLSDRQHTSIGIGEGPSYMPVATVLDNNHPVMLRQRSITE